jgi:hypothetical protein
MDEVEFLPEPPRLPQRRRTDPQPATDSRVYQRGGNAALFGALKLVGGGMLIAFALLMFAIRLFSRQPADQLSLQFTTTLPILGGIALIAAGIADFRGPSQVTVDTEGLIITRRGVDRRLAWADIGLASAGQSPLSYRRRLSLFDPNGKLLERIPDSFTRFEKLAKLVRANVEEKAPSTSESLRMRKSRGHAYWMGPFACLMAVGSVFFAWKTWDTARGNDLLATVGKEGEAKILSRHMAPNGVTCRLEFEVTGDNGQTATHNVEVEPEYWDELEEETTVPVRYVPAEPGFCHLISGEIPSEDDFSSPKGYFLSAAAAAFAVLMAGGAVMQFYGWDFGTNPKTGKIGFFKLGT